MPLFVVMEGLSAVGKSTTAPLLAMRIGAALVTVPAPLAAVRVQLDGGNLMARLHFWMMCNYAVSGQTREHLATGKSVVVESYFYRTLATHAAVGAASLPRVDWDSAVVPDLAVLLTVDESERRRRLAERYRSASPSRWARLEESHVEVARNTYESFGLQPLDTNGLDPPAVVAGIIRELRNRRKGKCLIR